MPTQVQFRRGNEGQNNNFKGAAGEISINTDTNSVRVHNGITTGGFELARDDLSNVGNASISGILTATQFVGDGSGLTNLVATGVGVEIRDNISVVGTAATIDFGDNLVVSLAAGVATVTALNTSKWGASPSGITTSSNVGIGTTDPQYALHVIGDVRIVGILTVGNSSVTIDGNTNTINIGSGVTVYGNTGIVSASALYVNGANISNSSGYASTAGIATVASGLTPSASVNTTGIITASKFVGDGSGLTNLPISSDFVRTSAGIHTLGNVGVGTTNPRTALTVNGIISFSNTNVRIGGTDTGSSLLSTGCYNNFIGPGAGRSTTTGVNNNFFGRAAGYSSIDASDNNFFGFFAGYRSINSFANNFLGYEAGYYTTSGDYNNFLGYQAGYKSTSARGNNFFGRQAGYNNTTGCYNTFFNAYAGYSNSTACYNTFIGYRSGCSNTTASYNNFLGWDAGRCNTTGYYNNFFGSGAGAFNTVGYCNMFFGDSSGYCNTIGHNNTFLGAYSGLSTSASYKVIYGSGASTTNLFDAPEIDKDYQFAVGVRTDGNPSNYWLVGDENFNIGIGTITPTSKLQVGGTVTATAFVGDGSGLTGIVGTGSGVEVRDNGSVVGTASTIDFGDNLTVTFSAGIMTVTGPSPSGSGSDFVRTSAGIHTLGNVGVGTTNPRTALTVNGIISFSNTNVRIGGTDTGSKVTTSLNNVFIGVGAGNSISDAGGYSIFMGESAGGNATGGFDNIFMNDSAGFNNTTGSENIFLGFNAGYYNTTGSYNKFFGICAGRENTTGGYNNFFGAWAGRENTTGYSNNFFGGSAGRLNTTGAYNNFFGYYSGRNNTIGYYNNFLGAFSGISTSASDKIILGHGNAFNQLFDAPDPTKDTQFAVGVRTGPNPANYWLVGDENFNIGIGTTNPTSKLQVGGTVTATAFVGDGSGLTNLPAGPAGTSDFVRTSAGIHTLGNVGVGTTNPTTALQIGSVHNRKVIGFGTVASSQSNSSTNILIGDNSTGSSLTPQAGYAWLGLDNIFIGVSAGAATTTGSSNNFIGQFAGCSNTSGYYNNFLGECAGKSNTTGAGNNFLGSYATGRDNTTGEYNNFFGYGAGTYNTAGGYNNFFGYYAGHCNTIGAYNNFLGYYTGNCNTTGSSNNFIGYNAGYGNTTGNYNNFFGRNAGYCNTTGSYNSFFGQGTGSFNTTGSYNSFFGSKAGRCNQTGCNNTFLGTYAGISTSASDKIIIKAGYHPFDAPNINKDTQLAIGIRTSYVTPSRYWLVGDENFNIGIGTTNPSEKLSVTGNIALNQTTVYGSVQASTASTSVTGIHSGLSTSVYRSVEYTIQATSGTNYQAIKILAIHDGTTAYDTQYGNIYNTEVATFDVDISAGNVRLVAAASSTSTTNYTVNFIATKI